MSSSTSGQCTPSPSPISRKCARCAGVASDNRHDHASGTLITRPSSRYATIVSDVILTSRIRGSVLATMLMPCLRNCIVMNFDHPPYDIQLPGSKAVICCKLNGFKPEFTRPVFSPNVHMNRLITVKTIKEEPVRSRDVFDPWHSMMPSLICYQRLPYRKFQLHAT